MDLNKSNDTIGGVSRGDLKNDPTRSQNFKQPVNKNRSVSPSAAGRMNNTRDMKKGNRPGSIEKVEPKKVRITPWSTS